MSEKTFKANVQGFELSVVTPEVVVSNNVDKLVTFIEERVKDYSPELYGGNADAAKKDRAELNKGVEQVYAIRQQIQALNPYGDVIAKLVSAEKLIKSGADALGNIVKAREDEEKEAKRKLIETAWADSHFDLFPLEKVFNPKWLNKTYKLTDIAKEIVTVTQRVYNDLKTIEGVSGKHAEAVKAKYLADLDLSAALEYGKQLAENERKAEVEVAGRAERVHEERIEAQKQEVRYEAERVAREAPMKRLVSEVFEEEVSTGLDEYVFKVSVTDSQLVGLKNYLTQQGVEYVCNRIEF